MDHIVPKYHIPSGCNPDTFWNTRVAHRTCNGRKGRSLPSPKEIRWDLIQAHEAAEARRIIRRAMWWRWPDSAWPAEAKSFLAGQGPEAWASGRQPGSGSRPAPA